MAELDVFNVGDKVIYDGSGGFNIRTPDGGRLDLKDYAGYTATIISLREAPHCVELRFDDAGLQQLIDSWYRDTVMVYPSRLSKEE